MNHRRASEEILTVIKKHYPAPEDASVRVAVLSFDMLKALGMTYEDFKTFSRDLWANT